MRRSLLPSTTLWFVLVALVGSACSSGQPFPAVIGTPDDVSTGPAVTGTVSGTALPGMPPVQDPRDIYAADRPNLLSPVVANFPTLVYVPNSGSNTVDVIDPKTMKVVSHFPVGKQPQHVVPSYDLKMLYATDDLSNDLPHRSGDGETRCTDPGRRPLQPLLHARRPLRDRRGRAHAAPGLPRPPHHGDPKSPRGVL